MCEMDDCNSYACMQGTCGTAAGLPAVCDRCQKQICSECELPCIGNDAFPGCGKIVCPECDEEDNLHQNCHSCDTSWCSACAPPW